MLSLQVPLECVLISKYFCFILLESDFRGVTLGGAYWGETWKKRVDISFRFCIIKISVIVFFSEIFSILRCKFRFF